MMLLNKIENPDDIKDFSPPELESLCQAIRTRIIEVLAKKGGHLASNIGSVELIVALHKVFHSPQDKMIFDTSHQTYSHKILTNRNYRFDTIRQYEGLCGFSNPKESPHDHFFAGHAGTALSLALGLAAARDLNESEEYVIPILGDAAFSCGLTLEALNNLPRGIKKFIILLNDNDMFISESTGNINEFLRKYVKQNQDSLEAVLKRLIPVKPFSQRTEDHVSFFEHFGLKYIGVIDGHDVNGVIKALEYAKTVDGPVIIHTMTKKGQGMEKALNSPTLYHGVGCFNLETGDLDKKPSSSLTFPKIFGDYLLQMGHNDPDLAVITPAMRHGACLNSFMKTFPERSFDVGIAEGHALTFGAGLAYQKKKRVVVSIYATFLQRALDNLFQDVCLQEIPMVLALDRAGLSPSDGSTHHGIFDIGFLKAMPEQVIVQPRDGNLLIDLMDSAFTYNKVVAIRYPNQSTTHTTNYTPKFRHLGKGEILKKGKDVAIIALGHMCKIALQVAESLRLHGIEATVMDPIFVKPLDEPLLLELALNHTHFVTIEEHSITSGLGTIISSFISQNRLKNINLQMFGIPDRFIEHGDYQSLLKEIGLTPDQIKEKILSQIQESRELSHCS
jgi:1-deoxy-D-xylulose-5-phosphate synthase